MPRSRPQLTPGGSTTLSSEHDIPSNKPAAKDAMLTRGNCNQVNDAAIVDADITEFLPSYAVMASTPNKATSHAHLYNPFFDQLGALPTAPSPQTLTSRSLETPTISHQYDLFQLSSSDDSDSMGAKPAPPSLQPPTSASRGPLIYNPQTRDHEPSSPAVYGPQRFHNTSLIHAPRGGSQMRALFAASSHQNLPYTPHGTPTTSFPSRPQWQQRHTGQQDDNMAHHPRILQPTRAELTWSASYTPQAPTSGLEEKIEVGVKAEAKSTAKREPAYFPFTKLPGELRNRIYEFTLPSDEVIVAEYYSCQNTRYVSLKKPIQGICFRALETDSNVGERPGRHIKFRLLSINRQIRREALAILAKNNTIEVAERELVDLLYFLHADARPIMPKLKITVMNWYALPSGQSSVARHWAQRAADYLPLPYGWNSSYDSKGYRVYKDGTSPLRHYAPPPRDPAEFALHKLLKQASVQDLKVGPDLSAGLLGTISIVQAIRIKNPNAKSKLQRRGSLPDIMQITGLKSFEITLEDISKRPYHGAVVRSWMQELEQDIRDVVTVTTK